MVLEKRFLSNLYTIIMYDVPNLEPGSPPCMNIALYIKSRNEVLMQGESSSLITGSRITYRTY